MCGVAAACLRGRGGLRVVLVWRDLVAVRARRRTWCGLRKRNGRTSARLLPTMSPRDDVMETPACGGTAVCLTALLLSSGFLCLYNGTRAGACDTVTCYPDDAFGQGGWVGDCSFRPQQEAADRAVTAASGFTLGACIRTAVILRCKTRQHGRDSCTLGRQHDLQGDLSTPFYWTWTSWAGIHQMVSVHTLQDRLAGGSVGW
jgi:hypothetical protein